MIKLLGVIAAALLLGGCAMEHTMTWTVPVVADPAEGLAVRIVKVDDVRVFVANAEAPTPTLADARAVADRRLTDRAVGNRAGGRNILFEVMLPPGRTTAGLFRDAVTDAMRRSGYRVGETANALPVFVEVKQFWINAMPPSVWDATAWTATVSTKVEAEVTAPLQGFEHGVVVKFEDQRHSARGAEGSDDWTHAAIEGFEKALQAKLPRP
jgi:uncharacterized lipoprotein YajG